MTLLKPYIVYLHSHDTGRHVQPYGRLLEWMASTDAPLLADVVEPEEGSELNLPSQISPEEPTIVVRRS